MYYRVADVAFGVRQMLPPVSVLIEGPEVVLNVPGEIRLPRPPDFTEWTIPAFLNLLWQINPLAVVDNCYLIQLLEEAAAVSRSYSVQRPDMNAGNVDIFNVTAGGAFPLGRSRYVGIVSQRTGKELRPSLTEQDRLARQAYQWDPKRIRVRPHENGVRLELPLLALAEVFGAYLLPAEAEKRARWLLTANQSSVLRTRLFESLTLQTMVDILPLPDDFHPPRYGCVTHGFVYLDGKRTFYLHLREPMLDSGAATECRVGYDAQALNIFVEAV